MWRAKGGSPTWTPGPSRIRPPLSYSHKEKGGKRRRREGKGGSPNPSPIRFGLGGGVRLHLADASSLPIGPMKAH